MTILFSSKSVIMLKPSSPHFQLTAAWEHGKRRTEVCFNTSTSISQQASGLRADATQSQRERGPLRVDSLIRSPRNAYRTFF